jgi:hypothetical protein
MKSHVGLSIGKENLIVSFICLRSRIGTGEVVIQKKISLSIIKEVEVSMSRDLRGHEKFRVEFRKNSKTTKPT